MIVRDSVIYLTNIFCHSSIEIIQRIALFSMNLFWIVLRNTNFQLSFNLNILVLAIHFF